MISFVIALALLICGYAVYGRLAEKVFGSDASRPTPAISMADGVDYVPMPFYKIFLIQFLNIAGLGPIFGAIMGVMYGPAAFLWIVFGTILAGGVHDYMAAMMSLRDRGLSLPEIAGQELGSGARTAMRAFALLLMLLVGAVFVYNPADLLALLTPESLDRNFWIWIILAYYIAATLLPIDKLIGKIYPIFGLALLFMAIGIMVMLFVNYNAVPEVWEQFYNHKPNPEATPIFPMMFVSIACGAISGFHATQSPLMARCMTSERYGRPVFYGAMVAEGIVALIWAAAAVAFTGGYQGLEDAVGASSPAVLVDNLSKSWLGSVGGVLAILGVVAAPISTGDTALRSARLIAADFMHIEQGKLVKRIMVSVPLLLACFVIMMLPYEVMWRYFAWCNQIMAAVTLWAISVWLRRHGRWYWISVVPALFMTVVTVSYIFYAPEGLGVLTDSLWGFKPTYEIAIGVGMAAMIGAAWLFFRPTRRAVIA